MMLAFGLVKQLIDFSRYFFVVYSIVTDSIGAEQGIFAAGAGTIFCSSGATV